MSPKSIVMTGLIIGSLIGGYLPTLFGASIFSFSSFIGNTLGGIIGVYVSYTLFVSR